MRPLGLESDAAEKRSWDSEFLGFPLPSESSLRSLVKKEQEYALNSDYLMRLLSERQLSARRNDAINWMWKVPIFFAVIFSHLFFVGFFFFTLARFICLLVDCWLNISHVNIHEPFSATLTHTKWEKMGWYYKNCSCT